MITFITLLLAAPLFVIAGMTLEWRTGRMDHWIRQVEPPVHFPPPQPVRTHDAFIDDCERWNRAYVDVPVCQRVLDPPETVQ